MRNEKIDGIGQVIKQLTVPMIKQQLILVPKIEQQKEIANKINEINKKINELEKLLYNIEAKKKNILNKFF